MPNPLTPVPRSPTEAAMIARGKQLFTNEVARAAPAARAAITTATSMTNGVIDDTFQDFNIHEPGRRRRDHGGQRGPVHCGSTTTTSSQEFDPPQDEGGRQNISSRNTKHLRVVLGQRAALAASRRRAHDPRDPADARLAAAAAGRARLQLPHRAHRSQPRRRVRLPRRPPNRLPTEVPITFADSATAALELGRRQGADLRQPGQPVRRKRARPGDDARLPRGPPGGRPARHQQRRAAHRRRGTDQPGARGRKTSA